MVVYDHIRKSEDFGVNKVAKQKGHYFLLGHFIKYKDFLFTTGASVPVNIGYKTSYSPYEMMQLHLGL